MNAITQDIDNLLAKTKGQLFMTKGAAFLGSLMAKVQFEWDDKIPTAGINAKTLKWNPEFFLSLDQDTRVTVLAHELLHNAYLHGARRKERDPTLWNIAGDHVINLFLKEHGYYMGGFPYVMDEKYAGWSTDDIYDDIFDNAEKIPFPSAIGEGIGSDVIDFDDDEVAEAVGNVVGAKALASMSKMAGSMPGEIQDVIDEFLNPKLPWEVILFNHMNELCNDEYSYARPNRRYDDPLLPGMTGRNGLEHLVYMVDTSGSITDRQVVQMNTEVKFIQEELGPERLSLICFDTEIRKIIEMERDDEFDRIEIEGRGGTDLNDCWEFLRKERPNAAVVFSDMWVDIPPDPGLPVIWVCTDNPDYDPPSYGKLVHMDTESD